ncbi:MAG: divalent metal cation transporter [Roseibacillus sp.]
MSDQYERELAAIESVADAPPAKKFFAYAKLSGPGWLQGAITLGGGSLAGALFLGSTSGFGAMWVQPLAMICGIIMLSAIAYVTLSTGNRPFHSINRHLNPLLGWSWLIATIMANMVWTMPQFALATASIQQNLLGGADFNPITITIPLLILGLFVNWLYESGGQGAKTFDLIIKVMVAIIILSFMAVVIALLTSGQLPIAKILGGYFPNPLALFKPSPTYDALIAQSNFPEYWSNKITDQQRDVTFAAFGSAVGINMTFLLPYTLLKKRWGKKHRGLSITDLSIGLFVPFFLATSCVVIASASSFHGKAELPEGEALIAAQTAVAETMGAERVAANTVGNADILLTQMLTKRDAGALAITLEPFAGKVISQRIFGVGVLGMAVSTIIILMLMNGLAFQEAFSKSSEDGAAQPSPNKANINDNKALFFLGCTLSGLAGCCFPLLWTGESKAALAVPTSVIGGSLIPIAYFTFFLMMNSKKILGEHRPEGKTRLIWNALMLFATSIATSGSVWVLLGKAEAPGWIGNVAKGGLAFLVLLFIVGTLSFLKNEKKF